MQIMRKLMDEMKAQQLKLGIAPKSKAPDIDRRMSTAVGEQEQTAFANWITLSVFIGIVAGLFRIKHNQLYAIV